jgi:nicotinamidase-related amidase
MKNFRLKRSETAVLIVDVQEKLFPLVERACDVLQAMTKLIKGCRILNVPIFASEQYPQGLGPTIGNLKLVLDSKQKYWSKTTFSCCGDPTILEEIKRLPIEQWIIAGIETHVCVLQTTKDLLSLGKQVTVLNDAISSRSIYDYSTAIAEMRDCGARISSVETALFELLGNSKDPEFRDISQLIK